MSKIDRGWFKAVRSQDALELIKSDPFAFVLAYIIATRANWHDGFNHHNLSFGQAFIGDFESYGMSERNYRTAKQHLSKYGFATFKATNKGTIAKLIDTRLFDVVMLKGDGQNADRRRTGDGQATSNVEHKEPKSRGKRAPWQLLRDEETLTKRIRQEAESTNPDRPLIESLKAQRRQVRDEMKASKP